MRRSIVEEAGHGLQLTMLLEHAHTALAHLVLALGERRGALPEAAAFTPWERSQRRNAADLQGSSSIIVLRSSPCAIAVPATHTTAAAMNDLIKSICSRRAKGPDAATIGA
jgi:hypothetical protein